MTQNENFFWHMQKCKLYFTSHEEVWRITSTKCFYSAECELVREWEKYSRGGDQGMETFILFQLHEAKGLDREFDNEDTEEKI